MSAAVSYVAASDPLFSLSQHIKGCVLADLVASPLLSGLSSRIDGVICRLDALQINDYDLIVLQM